MLGRWDVDSLYREIPRKLREEWMEFFEISPPDGRRLDVLGGIVASTIANVHRDSDKRGTPYPVEDFIWDWDDSRVDEPMTPEEINEAIRAAKGAKAALQHGNHHRTPGPQDQRGDRPAKK